MVPHDDSEPSDPPHLGAAGKRLAHHLMAICENRLDLVMVELEEERNQIIRACWLAITLAVAAMLAGVALTVAIAVACWAWSPVGAMLIVAALHCFIALICYGRLARLRREWRTLPATLEEFKKDRACLLKHLGQPPWPRAKSCCWPRAN